MAKYKTRKTLNESIDKLYTKGYKKEGVNTLKTNEKLMKKLSKYSVSTQREFLAQAEKVGFTASESLTFIRATERYNRNRQKTYDKYVKDYVNPAWEKYVDEQTNAWKRRAFGDKGGLTKEGKEMYGRFLDDQLSPVIALQDKSIIIGDWVSEGLSKENILETRMRMGMDDYLDIRTKQYIENYKQALKESHENTAQWYIDKFEGLTNKQKMDFIRNGGQIIQQTYIVKDETAYYEAFMEILDKVTESDTEKDSTNE